MVSESIRILQSPSGWVRILANIPHSHPLRVRWPSSQDLFHALPLNLGGFYISSFWLQHSWILKKVPKGSGYMFFKNGATWKLCPGHGVTLALFCCLAGRQPSFSSHKRDSTVDLKAEIPQNFLIPFKVTTVILHS